MGLLNDVKAAEAKPVAKVMPTDKAEKKERAKARKAEKREALQKVLDYLAKNPVAELADAVKKLTVVERSGGGFAPAFTVEMLFGENAKAGAKISALDVFTKFKKGYPEMRKYIKKWAEKGVKVHLDAASQSYVLD